MRGWIRTDLCTAEVLFYHRDSRSGLHLPFVMRGVRCETRQCES
jgi:hypothetical protein